MMHEWWFGGWPLIQFYYSTVPYQKNCRKVNFSAVPAAKCITLISSVLINNDSNDMKFCRNNDIKV